MLYKYNKNKQTKRKLQNWIKSAKKNTMRQLFPHFTDKKTKV